ncbi:hypothetical protein BU17DRAFT_96452 [Hysterangium stoloniferum]|nr:hypothetical protein BU17DRAFT_96452 [Hysterangium stoloniferum]
MLPLEFFHPESASESDKDRSNRKGRMASDKLLLRSSQAWQANTSANNGAYFSDKQIAKEPPRCILRPLKLRLAQIPKPLDCNHDVLEPYVGQVSKNEPAFDNEISEVSESYKPSIAFEINCGVHHEVWDPQSNGVYKIEGSITHETQSPQNLFTLPFRLVGITIEASIVHANSRGPVLARASTSFKSCKNNITRPNSESVTTEVQKDFASKKAKEGPKLGNMAGVKHNNLRRFYIVPLPEPVVTTPPELKLTIGQLESCPINQRLSFAIEIPVGTHGIRPHTTSMPATTVYSLKAKGTAKVFICGKVCEHAVEATVAVSVSVLKKMELMDGEVMSLVVSEGERKRRKPLCIY